MCFHYFPSSALQLGAAAEVCCLTFSWKFPLHLLGHEKDVKVAEIMKYQFCSGSSSSCLCGWGMSGQVELQRGDNQERAGNGDAQQAWFGCRLREHQYMGKVNPWCTPWLKILFQGAANRVLQSANAPILSLSCLPRANLKSWLLHFQWMSQEPQVSSLVLTVLLPPRVLCTLCCSVLCPELSP